MIGAVALADAFRSHRFRASDERDVQDGIESILRALGIEFTREAQLDAERKWRIDFLCAGGLGIEVKIAGSLADVTRQLHAYAQQPSISSLVLVTARMQHRRVPQVFNGKTIDVVHLRGAL